MPAQARTGDDGRGDIMWWPFSIQVDDAPQPDFFAAERNGSGSDDERKRLHSVLRRMNAEWIRFDKYYERNHRRYQQLRGYQIVISALIPISALLPTFHAVSADAAVAMSGVLGAVTTVFASLDSMYRSRESYLRAANTRDLLSHEFGLYSAHAKPYDGAGGDGKVDSIALLGGNVEKILADELKQYKQDESKETANPPTSDGAANIEEKAPGKATTSIVANRKTGS